ncbi:RES family NAD+ phosphorylase [Paenibacillus xylanivorans]|uniref:RES domain-containing protein n=1 Tax=Paenibacillus xylanivorans TaxID=1705561 RepID=A0A0N0C2F5_9BACL|nr:RES family NAD+ phosphorylase [Paenibacillus xylanivorans]KOY12737.1 hypothetical protein AMS66_30560 [Paenibacillus xylanivorans]
MYIAQPEDTDMAIQEYIDQIKERRFFIDKESRLLDIFISSLNTFNISKEDVFYRGRILDEGKTEYTDSELHAPPINLVGVGRLNPRRVRYLYVTDTAHTAAAELRPWISAVVVVGKAIPKRELKVLNFVPTEEEKNKEKSYRRQVSQMFSQPVRPNISDVEYLVTQSIAEYVKLKGFDGIRYQSAVDSKGVNYCLFDPESMNIENSHKLKINHIDYGISEAP